MAEKKDKKAEILDRLEQSRKYKADFIADCEDYYYQYRGKFQKVMKGRANIWVQITLGLIESEMPRYIGSRPKIEYEARLPEYRGFNKQVNAKIEYDWIANKFALSMYDLAKVNLLFGFAMGYVPWQQVVRKVRSFEPVEYMGFQLPWNREVIADKVIREGPALQVVTPWRAWWDPEGYDIDSCGWVAHGERISRDVIGRALEQKVWKNPSGDDGKKLKETLDKADKWDRFYVLTYCEDEYRAKLILAAESMAGSGDNFREHGGLNIGEFQKIGADGPFYMVEETDFPYDDGEKPYILARNIPLIQEFEGMGEAEVIQPQQRELNILRSTRLDNVNAAINRMWIIRKEANIDPEELKFRPNGTIEVSGLPISEAIKELQTSEIHGATIQDEESIKRDVEYATGQRETRMGLSAGRNERTATAHLQAEASADARMQQKVQYFEMATLEPLGYKLLARNRQFVTEEIAFRTLGAAARDWQIGPAELQPEYYPIVRGKGTQPHNKAVRIQEFISFLNMLRVLPTLAERFNPDALALEGAERFELDQVPNIIFSPEEVQNRRNQAAMLQQQQASGQAVAGRQLMAAQGGR